MTENFIEVRALAPHEVSERLDDLARLRIEVFRAFPYLYEGDMEYEHRYLQAYCRSDDAVVVGAFDGDVLVGAATGTPFADHADEFAAAFTGSGIDLTDCFYFAESVLLQQYRGRGIGHRFFDLREAHAVARGYRDAAFCAVLREDHPLMPADYQPLDGFWLARGYRKLDGVVASFEWPDIGECEASAKDLQFWHRCLTDG